MIFGEVFRINLSATETLTYLLMNQYLVINTFIWSAEIPPEGLWPMNSSDPTSHKEGFGKAPSQRPQR